MPALEAGRAVICDRFVDSTLAYQGYGRGLDLATLEQLQRFAVGDLTPDLTIYLRVSVETAFSRLRRKKDRLEQEDAAFFQRVANGYDALAKRYAERCAVIHSAESIDAVFSKVVRAVLPLLTREED